MNTRSFPRSMAQAFPRTCLYACAVERPYVSLTRRLWVAIWRWL